MVITPNYSCIRISAAPAPRLLARCSTRSAGPRDFARVGGRRMTPEHLKQVLDNLGRARAAAGGNTAAGPSVPVALVNLRRRRLSTGQRQIKEAAVQSARAAGRAPPSRAATITSHPVITRFESLPAPDGDVAGVTWSSPSSDARVTRAEGHIAVTTAKGVGLFDVIQCPGDSSDFVDTYMRSGAVAQHTIPAVVGAAGDVMIPVDGSVYRCVDAASNGDDADAKTPPPWVLPAAWPSPFAMYHMLRLLFPWCIVLVDGSCASGDFNSGDCNSDGKNFNFDNNFALLPRAVTTPGLAVTHSQCIDEPSATALLVLMQSPSPTVAGPPTLLVQLPTHAADRPAEQWRSGAVHLLRPPANVPHSGGGKPTRVSSLVAVAASHTIIVVWDTGLLQVVRSTPASTPSAGFLCDPLQQLYIRSLESLLPAPSPRAATSAAVPSAPHTGFCCALAPISSNNFVLACVEQPPRPHLPALTLHLWDARYGVICDSLSTTEELTDTGGAPTLRGVAVSPDCKFVAAAVSTRVFLATLATSPGSRLASSFWRRTVTLAGLPMFRGSRGGADCDVGNSSSCSSRRSSSSSSSGSGGSNTNAGANAYAAAAAASSRRTASAAGAAAAVSSAHVSTSLVRNVCVMRLRGQGWGDMGARQLHGGVPLQGTPSLCPLPPSPPPQTRTHTHTCMHP